MEHSFPVNLVGKTYHWKLYDVGGAVSDLIAPMMDVTFDTTLAWTGVLIVLGVRVSSDPYQRSAWVPYFDDGKSPPSPFVNR
jgi:hypothetical protein